MMVWMIAIVTSNSSAYASMNFAWSPNLCKLLPTHSRGAGNRVFAFLLISVVFVLRTGTSSGRKHF